VKRAGRDSRERVGILGLQMGQTPGEDGPQRVERESLCKFMPLRNVSTGFSGGIDNRENLERAEYRHFFYV
jgi:hypothetical protein